MKEKIANITRFVTALWYLMIVKSNTKIYEVHNMKKTLVKILSIVMLLSMCCSMMSLVALAETTEGTFENTETGNTEVIVKAEGPVEGAPVENEDGSATTVTTTTFDLTVSDAEENVIATVTITDYVETTVSTENGKFVEDEVAKEELFEELPEVADPTVGDAPELSVNLGSGGEDIVSDSATPDVIAPEGGKKEYDEKTGETTVTTTVSGSTVSDTEKKSGTSTDDKTTSVTIEETTTVKAEVTETVVITDRTLDAVLSEATENKTEGDVVETVNADVAELNSMLKEMGIIENELSNDEAKAVLAEMNNPETQNETVLAMKQKGNISKDEEKSEAADETAPTIVVSDVTFTVGDEVSENSGVYETQISFTVVIEEGVTGATVSVLDKDGNPVIYGDGLKAENIAIANGQVFLPELNLSEGMDMNYNLKFDYNTIHNMGADAYVYNATVNTVIQTETPAENDTPVQSSEDKPTHNYIVSVDGANNNNASIQFKGNTCPAEGQYTVILPDGTKLPASMINKKLYVDMDPGRTGIDIDNWLPDGGSVTIVDENGYTFTVGTELQTGKPSEGHNKYNATDYKQNFNHSENYEYEFGYDKSKEVSAQKNMTINFSVNESSITSSTEITTYSKVDTTTTTVREWSERNETPVEKPEEPEEEPEQQLNAPGPVSFVDDGEVIEDELVPLAKAPSTGSVSLIFAVAAASSGLGLAGLAFTAKRKDYDPKH